MQFWSKHFVSWTGKVETRGSDLFEYTRLNNLRFADDVVIIAKSDRELENMVGGLAGACSEMGLAINKSKTMILTNIENFGEIKIDGEPIAVVSECRYLGQTLSFKDKTNKELKIRRANGWKAFWSMKSLWRSKIKLKLKIRMFESLSLIHI